MKIEIRTSGFDPYYELARYVDAMPLGKTGGSVNFIGTMRDFNEGTSVSAMTLEHYPGMTEKALQVLCDKAMQDWSLDDLLVLHRVGKVLPGDPIVLVAVWSAHRAEAFAACRFVIDELKHKATFWKKEKLGEGERWVEKNN